jgi:DNA-binding LacI/PurR family transcriptional regulator
MNAFQNAVRKNIPVLNIFGQRENIPSVYAYHKRAVYDCMKMLAQNGHRKIAYIGPDFRIENDDFSFIYLKWAREGMLQAVQDYGLDFCIERDCVFAPDYKFDYEKIKKLLQQGDYTAVFGWTVPAGIAFYSICRELGYIIGKDISFIGLEGEQAMQGFHPPPTYYEFDYNAMLDAATQFVQNKGKNFPIFTETGFTLNQGSSICKI